MRTLTPVLCTSGLAAEAKVARAAGFQVIVGAGEHQDTERKQRFHRTTIQGDHKLWR